MPDRFYWDSCVFLSYLNETPGRVEIIEDLLSQAKAKKIEIYTATVSVVEVAFSEAERGHPLDAVAEQRIDAFWNDREAIKLIDVHTLIEREARKLIRDGLPLGWTGLGAMDSIHLAAAASMKLPAFHTYDVARLKRYESIVGFTIDEPSVVQLPLISGTQARGDEASEEPS